MCTSCLFGARAPSLFSLTPRSCDYGFLQQFIVCPDVVSISLAVMKNGVVGNVKTDSHNVNIDSLSKNKTLFNKDVC